MASSPTSAPETPQQTQLPRASGKFISHVLTLITGNGLAQLVNVVGTLVLARFFAPEAFGSFALFVTLVSFLSVLGGARYELAIMLPETDEEGANILFLAVLMLTGISAGSFLLVALLRSPLAQLFGDVRLGLWLWTLPLALFVNGLYQVLALWYGRMKRFRFLALVRVCQASGIVGGQLALLKFYPGGFALVGGWLFGQTLGTTLLVVQLFVSDRNFLFKARNWAQVRASAGKYRNFPMYKAPYSFIANASSQLVVVIMRVFSDLNIVGLYSMAARAVYLPVSLIASSMNDVFYEKAATELKQGGLESFVTRLLRIQVVLAAPLLVLTAFDAKLIFGLILGPKWVPAATYAAILSFASFMYFLTSWLDRLFDVRGRQKLSLILEFSGNVLSLGGLTLALWWDPKNAVFAVGVYAAVQVLYASVWLVFAYHVAGFGTKALGLLLRDAVATAGTASVLIGSVHLILRGWPAFFLSAACALCMIVVAFVRYVSTGRAFSTTAERFRQFWADKDSTLNGRDGEQFWRAQAEEITSLFPTQPPGRVLEIGCGDGNLFPHFGIPSEDYKGVDFSPQFLDRFRSKQPGVTLECAEGASYFDGSTTYDVILLNGIVQHFDLGMLQQHLQNANSMLAENGMLIWGSVPQRRYRRLYDAGKWSASGAPRLSRLVKSWIGRMMGLDAMGYWYEPIEVATLTQRLGLNVRFVPSELYPYRFHAVIQRKPAYDTETRENQNSQSSRQGTRELGLVK